MLKNNKKTILESISFLVILMIILTILNIGYIAIVLKNTTLERVEMQLNDRKDDIRIMFLGDSHPLTSINPRFINNSFNFASGGENLFLNYFKFKKILEDDEFKIDVVVIQTDLHTFLFRDDVEWATFDSYPNYWRKYVSIIDIYHLRQKFSLNDAIMWEINSLIPFIGQDEQFIDFLGMSEEDRIKGFDARELIDGMQVRKDKFEWANESKRYKKANRTAIDHFIDFGKISTISDSKIDYFQKILDLAEEQGLQVVLIKYPITEEYYNLSKKYIDNELYYDRIFSITREYCNVYLLDYQKEYFGQYSLFHDEDHLNIWGSEIFSKQINEEFKKLGLIN